MSNRPSKPAKDRSRVVVAYIHPGQTSALFTHSMIGLGAYDRARDNRIADWITEWSSANVSQARNTVVARFLEQRRGDWLLFVDADMEFGPDAVDALLKNADPERAPIVGGLCFGSANGFLFPTIYHLTQTDDGRPVTVRVSEYERNAMVQVAATGAAFLLIHRTVLTVMRDKAFNATFPWFQETDLAGNVCGEDLTFCLRAMQLGFPVWVNTAVKVGHHKSQVLTEELFLAQQQALA